jgi:DNA-binding NarL/FixJ family response regulator
VTVLPLRVAPPASAQAPLKVVVVDDDDLVREGARSVLSSVPGVEVVGLAANPTELDERIVETFPQVVVLDIRMPPTYRMEGIEAAHKIRAEHPGLGVVLLSQHADPEYALEFLRPPEAPLKGPDKSEAPLKAPDKSEAPLKAPDKSEAPLKAPDKSEAPDGSAGRAYLLKERLGDPAQLVEAIREVAAGGSVLDPKVVDGLLEAQRRRAHSRLKGLTEREHEVLRLMASGRNNGSVARDLVLPERAVEGHITSIFRKLGLPEQMAVNQRVPAVLFFLARVLE